MYRSFARRNSYVCFSRRTYFISPVPGSEELLSVCIARRNSCLCLPGGTLLVSLFCPEELLARAVLFPRRNSSCIRSYLFSRRNFCISLVPGPEEPLALCCPEELFLYRSFSSRRIPFVGLEELVGTQIDYYYYHSFIRIYQNIYNDMAKNK